MTEAQPLPPAGRALESPPARDVFYRFRHKDHLPMAVRATWKGHVKIAELSFPVALYAAATTSKRMSFHILNRATGHRVLRQYIDESTEKPVAAEQQVKGYATDDERYIILEPEELAQSALENDKTIRIEAFIDCGAIDTMYFDRPYSLKPADDARDETFAIIREGMRRKKVAALARAVLFRKMRTLLLRADGPGLVANTLNFDYEVRPAEEVFDDLPDIKIGAEMVELAKHIIKTKAGAFDPRSFDDRYDQALKGLIEAKMAGRKIPRARSPKQPKVVNLMDALRESAKAVEKQAPDRRKKAERTQRRRTG